MENGFMAKKNHCFTMVNAFLLYPNFTMLPKSRNIIMLLKRLLSILLRNMKMLGENIL